MKSLTKMTSGLEKRQSTGRVGRGESEHSPQKERFRALKGNMDEREEDRSPRGACLVLLPAGGVYSELRGLQLLI